MLGVPTYHIQIRATHESKNMTVVTTKPSNTISTSPANHRKKTPKEKNTGERTRDIVSLVIKWQSYCNLQSIYNKSLYALTTCGPFSKSNRIVHGVSLSTWLMNTGDMDGIRGQQ